MWKFLGKWATRIGIAGVAGGALATTHYSSYNSGYEKAQKESGQSWLKRNLGFDLGEFGNGGTTVFLGAIGGLLGLVSGLLSGVGFGTAALIAGGAALAGIAGGSLLTSAANDAATAEQKVSFDNKKTSSNATSTATTPEVDQTQVSVNIHSHLPTKSAAPDNKNPNIRNSSFATVA